MYNPSRIRESKVLPALVLFLFLFLYLCFPSGQSTSDGWGYAAEIRHSGQLFSPYHLLYNALGRLFCLIPVTAGADTLMCLKVMNSLFAILTLFAVQLIVRQQGGGLFTAALISSLAGISFGFMRFATENETYIVPLCLALYSYSRYIEFSGTGHLKHSIMAGLLASLSVLFHLSYILFWLGIFTGIISERKRKASLLFMSVSLVVPLVCLSVIFHLYGSLSLESARDFFLSGFQRHIGLGLTWRGIFFTFINLVRSFIQVHGYIFYLVKQNILLAVPAVGALVFFGFSLFELPSGFKKPEKQTSVIIMVLILMFLFAMFSEGNAEFMVMIPVFSFILFASLFKHQEKFMKRFFAGVVIWNISYGLVPLHVNSPEAENYLYQKSQEENSIVIASDALLLQNMIYYKTGKSGNEKIFRSPALLPGVTGLENSIDSALTAGNRVYTDCIGKKAVSRASITEGDANEEFFVKYNSVPEISFQTISGEREIRIITGKR